MGSVIRVMLLELAGICLPPQVLAVDKRNGFVGIITGLMLDVGVESIARVSL